MCPVAFVKVATLGGLLPGVREHLVVDTRMERHGADGGEQRAGGLSLRGEHRLGGQGAQGVEFVGIDTGTSGEGLEHESTPLTVEHQLGGAALHDGPVEEALGTGRAEQREHAPGSGRLAEDRDVGGVAAEAGDVVADPFERSDLVEDAEVGGRTGVLDHEEPERADAVVDGDDHAVGARGEAGAVVGRE